MTNYQKPTKITDFRIWYSELTQLKLNTKIVETVWVFGLRQFGWADPRMCVVLGRVQDCEADASVCFIVRNSTLLRNKLQVN